MAYIQPSGTIEVMKNVPLSPEYNHTYYFDTPQQQYNYFTGKVFTAFNNQMYTRVSDGVCRVYGEAELLKECNYMRFNNHLPDAIGVNTKYYYAFITNVEYINHNVTEIRFVIDEIQTWFFETHFEKCFIERQHSTTDEIGDNIVPEPLNCDDYVVSGEQTVLDLSDSVYVLMLGAHTLPKVTSEQSQLFTRTTFSGLYSGVKYLYFSTADDVRKFLNSCEFSNGVIKALIPNLNTDLWEVIGLFAFPKNIISGSLVPITTNGENAYLVSDAAYERTVDSTLRPDSFNFETDVYEPINKKLLTYPFCFMRLDCVTHEKDFKYENMTTPYRYTIEATVNPTPCLRVYLQGYNNTTNPNNGIVIDSFPMLNIYSNNLFGSLGYNSANLIKSVVIAMASGAFGGGAEPASSSAYFTSTDIATIPDSPLGSDTAHWDAVRQSLKTEQARPKVGETKIGAHESLKMLSTNKNISGRGGVQNFAVDMAIRDFHIHAYGMAIKPEAARRFDQFLSKYGYAQDCIGVPNISARLRWTYIKTKGCLVTGNIPSTARVVIQNALDSGITYWNAEHATIGDYDFDNNGVLEG